jgi:hypothetical protein
MDDHGWTTRANMSEDYGLRSQQPAIDDLRRSPGALVRRVDHGK